MNNQSFDHIIIGAGFAGICMGIKLKQAGLNNFVILERNSHLGGTWWDNSYPGATCDVESHLYSYSFEPNPNWSRQFSPQEEILNYLEQCAAKYGMNEHLLLNSTVANATFNEAHGLWTVNTTTGKTYTAQIVVSCSGGLSQPSIPDIKGLKNYKGKLFHSARWDKNFDLKDKKVAVIGTGASSIQIVPAIAPVVKQLDVFQRTPAWIIPKPDKPISAFRRAMYNKLPFMRKLYRSRLYWTHEMMALGFTGGTGIMKVFSKVALMFIKKSISDETLRKKVTPNYVPGCKRILLSNDYYPALQLKNVAVITEGIKEINETGLMTVDGKQYNADAIIMATGFKAAEGVIAFDIKGKNGIDLNDVWRYGAEAYLGISISGFPNLFLVVGPNTGLGHSSMILMIEAQVNYIMDCIGLMKKDKLKFVDVKKTTEVEYNREIQEKLSKSVWQTGGCHSWYQDKNGKNVSLWPGFTFTFMKRTKKFEPEKYELVK